MGKQDFFFPLLDSVSLLYLIARTEEREWSVDKTISIAASQRIQGAGNMTVKESLAQ